MPYFEIGIYHPRNGVNIGTLWRSAYQLGAAGIFTIGKPYRRQSSDTAAAETAIPLRVYAALDELLAVRPRGARLVGVELPSGHPSAGKALPLSQFRHPPQAVYLLGGESGGLPPAVLERCDLLVYLQAVRSASYNVAVTGSIVMYHRVFLSDFSPQS